MNIKTILDNHIDNLNLIPKISLSDYALLIEELNHPVEEELTHYRGFELIVGELNNSLSIE